MPPIASIATFDSEEGSARVNSRVASTLTPTVAGSSVRSVGWIVDATGEGTVGDDEQFGPLHVRFTGRWEPESWSKTDSPGLVIGW